MAYTERYVTQGAGGGGAGTSGDPWTLAEALTNAVAGDRVNIQSDAGYSTGADSVTNAGTATQLIAFRGYNSTIGDLDTQGRNSNTSLNVTDFPVITVTGIVNPSAYNLWQNIHITGGVGTYNFGSTAADNIVYMSCKFTQTGTGLALLLDNTCSVVYCDIEATATNHGGLITGDNHINIVGCRFKGSATSGSPALLSIVNGCVLNSAFLGTSSTIGLNAEQVSLLWSIVGNTFYNCGTAIQTPNAAIVMPLLCVNNHITDCDKMFDNLYAATANHIIIEVSSRTRDNTTPRTGISTESLLVGEVTTDTGGAATDYVDAPGGDITLIAAAPAVDAGLGM